MAPWWWFPCKPKHVGAVLLILKCFNNSTFLNVVCISWKLKCWIQTQSFDKVTWNIHVTASPNFFPCFQKISTMNTHTHTTFIDDRHHVWIQLLKWNSNFVWYDIFVDCNWVVTRWQQYSTHLYKNTQNDTKQTIHRTTQQFGRMRAVPRLG